MIIDTHCHYNLSPLVETWRDHWTTAQARNITGSIVVGTSADTSTKAIEIVEDELRLFSSVGVHPTVCQTGLSPKELDQELQAITKLSSQPKVVAIGECGLDYYRLPSGEAAEEIKALQKNVLLTQLNLAKKTNLPLIIHLRDKNSDAYWDFLTLFKSVFDQPRPFILHCVSGPVEFVAECLELGAFIGVAGNVTYPSSSHIREIIKNSYRERVVVETDAPFLAPQEARGKICEPWMIQWTVEYLRVEFGFEYLDLVGNTVSLFPQFKNAI